MRTECKDEIFSVVYGSGITGFSDNDGEGQFTIILELERTLKFVLSNFLYKILSTNLATYFDLSFTLSYEYYSTLKTAI